MNPLIELATKDLDLKEEQPFRNIFKNLTCQVKATMTMNLWNSEFVKSVRTDVKFWIIAQLKQLCSSN